MPASRGRPARPRAHFDELAFSEDISHASAAGRRVALDARRQLERDGIDIGHLQRCDPHGRDGTELERCVKLYLPTAVGAWRMVFEITRDPASGGLVLAYLAFGLGHPVKPWRPSAYQIAHQLPTSRRVARSAQAGRATSRRLFPVSGVSWLYPDMARGPSS